MNVILIVIIITLNCNLTGGKLINFENKGRVKYLKKIDKPIECEYKIEKCIVDSLIKKPISNIKYYEINAFERAIYFIANDTINNNAAKEYFVIIDNNCEMLYVFRCKYINDDLINYW